MESSTSLRAVGWRTYASVVLVIAGVFGIIEGIVAVSKASFFAGNAVFVFSDLMTWGWIILGLGILELIAGLAVLTGSAWSRWFGIGIAGLGALGQLLFAQAYPLWSLVLIGVNLLVIYGLAVHGLRGSDVQVVSLEEPSVTLREVVSEERRVA